ncbi:MAG: hypothetical protein K2Z81_18805, partial [Cyanobacteria bacterium]|nr:hypothetical protein [Cyanobacteriota bacterium]
MGGNTESGINSLLESRARFFELFANRTHSFVRLSGSSVWRGVSKFHNVTDEELFDCVEGIDTRRRGFALADPSRFLVLLVQLDEGDELRWIRMTSGEDE